MKIGFIGFGEASSNIADGFLSADSKVEIVAYDVDKERAHSYIKSLACPNRIELLLSLKELLDSTNIVFTAVPGQYDFSLYNDIVSSAIVDKLFIDLSTAKPDVKKEISVIIENKKAKYVDVAVLGSVPVKKHLVPMMLSGSGAIQMMELFNSFSMDMQMISEEAGKASLVKLCRSIYMKGLAALSIEMTEVADAYGVKDLVYDSLAKSMDNDEFKVYTPRLINGTKKHLVRRTAEVEECLEIINKTGGDGFMTRATLDTYNKLK